jgi:2-dehydropantoate 2-reductase
MVKAQDGEIRSPVKIIEKVEMDDRYDTVLLCCKAYDLDGAINAIAPAIGERSVVLPVLNGIKHIATLADRFGAGCVLGGLTTINAALLPDGSIQQSQLKINTTAIGELDGKISDRCATIRLSVTVSDNITGMMWSKLFAFACSVTIATLTRSRAGSIARSATGTSFVAAVIEECTQIVAAEGFPPPADFVSILRGMFSVPESIYGPSMLIDMEQGRPTEAEHTIGDLVERAARRCIGAPILGAALCNLQAYEINRQKTVP